MRPTRPARLTAAGLITARAGGLAIALLFGGCKLVDQTTFNPGAGKLEPVAGPPGPPGPAALITVDFAKPNPAYEGPLRQAVDEAVARKPDVAFTVTTVVPAAGTTADQVAAASSLTADARAIARVISDEGVDEDRVTLSAQSEPDASGKQIRVYVH